MAELTVVEAQARPSDEAVHTSLHEPGAQDLPAVHLHHIAYSAATRDQCPEGYAVLDNVANPRPDWYEYWPIRQFLRATVLDESACYGFFSPKFQAKTGLSHAAVAAEVRRAVRVHQADVVLFSPQPDMGAFFLNVFEQGELFDPGLIAVCERYLASIGRPTDLRGLVMDSTQIVFSNYFVARPAFWRAWLAVCEPLFACCEAAPAHPGDTLARDLVAPTTYPGSAQRKVFVMERLASLLLATEPGWRSVAADPFAFAWSTFRFRDYPQEAVMSDALKMAYRINGFPEYLQAYGRLREQFAQGARPSAAA
jgi:hypothetical protein